MPRLGLRSMDSNTLKTPCKPGLFGLNQTDPNHSHLHDTRGGRRALNRLDELINTTKKRKSSSKHNNQQNSSPSSSKYKQLSISQFCSPPREKRVPSLSAGDQLTELTNRSKHAKNTFDHNEKSETKNGKRELKTAEVKKGTVNNNEKLRNKKQNLECKTSVAKKTKVYDSKKLREKQDKENLELKAAIGNKGKVDDSKKSGVKKVKGNLELQTLLGKKRKVDDSEKLREKQDKENLKLKTSIGKKRKIGDSKKSPEKTENENLELQMLVDKKEKVDNRQKQEKKEKENLELKTSIGKKRKVDNRQKPEEKKEKENLKLKTSIGKKRKIGDSKKLGEKKEDVNHTTAEGKKEEDFKTSNNKTSEKKGNLAGNKKSSQKKIGKGKINKQSKNNNQNTSVLTDWLIKSEDKSRKENYVSSAVTQPMGSSDDDHEVGKDKNKPSFKRKLSESFIKYGMYVPSFEDVVAYRTKVENQNKIIDRLYSDINVDLQKLLELKFEEPEVPEVAVLDCKDLNKEQLVAAFECNRTYVSDIFHGIRYSVRHARFKKQDVHDYGTQKDLKYNTSMLLFSFEQKQLLLSLFESTFDKDDELNKNDKYYFQVLLPELCTKIFMDHYNMGYEEAVAYLDKRPVLN